MKILAITLVALLPLSASADTDPVMKACGSAMDIAESSLRILLNKPAQGKFPKEMVTKQAKKEAKDRLYSLDQNCLNGTYGKSTWPQYNMVRALYEEFQTAGTKPDPVIKACGSSMDVAESSLRVILNKPANGSFPKEMITEDAKIGAVVRLKNVDEDCLNGAYGKSTWPQYNEVRSLYQEYQAKYSDKGGVKGRSKKLKACEADLASARELLSSRSPASSVNQLKNAVEEATQAYDEKPATKGSRRVK